MRHSIDANEVTINYLPLPGRGFHTGRCKVKFQGRTFSVFVSVPYGDYRRALAQAKEHAARSISQLLNDGHCQLAQEIKKEDAA